MQVQSLANGQRLTLDPTATLGAGGEAYIYTLPQDSSLVAKVYRTPDKVPARKLAVMITHPPADPMLAQGHISLAWPVALLSAVDGRQQVIGFLMPRVTGMRPLIGIVKLLRLMPSPDSRGRILGSMLTDPTLRRPAPCR
jgi:DNA-binding helix-hairpin-helix protein with protein kinase domain